MRPPPRPRRVAPVRADAGHDGTRQVGSRTASTPAPSSPPRPTAPRPDPVGTGADEPTGTALVVGLRSWKPVRPPVVSSGSAARFAERAEQRRRRTRQRLIIAASALTSALVIGWLLLVSPVLALDVAEVELRGQGTVVDAAAVTAVIQTHDRTPLPRLDTVGLRRAILEVPGVRAAEVARVWPHGLRVTLVAREPVAAVPQDAGFALLDVDGVQVGRSDAAPEGLPVITVPLDDPGARAMTAVLTVLQQLPPELLAEVVTASAASHDTVAFGLSGGARVEWGSADRTALKARVLMTLRSAPAGAGATVFDVSAPTLPITRS